MTPARALLGKQKSADPKISRVPGKLTAAKRAEVAASRVAATAALKDPAADPAHAAVLARVLAPDAEGNKQNFIYAPKDEYPFDQLPLGEITRQFSAYLGQHRAQLEQADLELGAEFFETASWLALLKSRALLPQMEGSGEAAPGEELRQALVSYDQARTLGDLMGERLEAAGMASSWRPETGTGNYF